MKQQPKICAYCGAEFIPERRHAIYCSPTCRQYTYLQKKNGESPGTRIKEKEFVNQQLQTVPALVIEKEQEQEAIPYELSIVPVKNYQSNQSRNTNLNNKETINTPAIESNSSELSYQDHLDNSKYSLNEILQRWWRDYHKNHKEKTKLVVANWAIRKFIERILKFDRKEISRIDLQKFQSELQSWRMDYPNPMPDFLPTHMVITDMDEIIKSHIAEIQASRQSTIFFKLPLGTKAYFEVLLQFMDEFSMQTPAFWWIP